MSKFNPETCAIPIKYCGNSNTVPKRKKGDPNYYTKKGTSYECLQQGFGAGAATERTKNLPRNSLQHIKYVSEEYEKRLEKYNIYTQADLVKVMKQTSPDHIFKILRRVMTKKNKLDERAYNSVLLYLYNHGVDELPPCKKIT